MAVTVTRAVSGVAVGVGVERIVVTVCILLSLLILTALLTVIDCIGFS